ncbi:MAG TPA: YciI family protein [Polyangiaceae bacterium]
MAKPTQKYLFLHHSEPGHGEGKPSPEQMQAMFAKWSAWKEKFKDNIVDWGDKLKPGGKMVTSSSVNDGPFVETKEIIGGFMIVSAESLEHAAAIAQEMPASAGARIEVREMAGAKM